MYSLLSSNKCICSQLTMILLHVSDHRRLIYCNMSCILCEMANIVLFHLVNKYVKLFYTTYTLCHNKTLSFCRSLETTTTHNCRHILRVHQYQFYTQPLNIRWQSLPCYITSEVACLIDFRHRLAANMLKTPSHCYFDDALFLFQNVLSSASSIKWCHKITYISATSRI